MHLVSSGDYSDSTFAAADGCDNEKVEYVGTD
jgi:hypothetical protein